MIINNRLIKQAKENLYGKRYSSGVGLTIHANDREFSIAYFVMAAKQKKCQTYVAVIVSILQFIFALDVVSLFCLSLMERKWMKLIISLAVILFAALAVIVILIAAVAG